MSDMNLVEQMLAAQEMTNDLVAELRAAGLDRLTIASILFNAAGTEWRAVFANEADRRKVILHAAEVAITNKPQPF